MNESLSMRALTGWCSLIAMLIGMYLYSSGRTGLAMHALPDGELLYPLSAGAEDAQLISGALITFGLTAMLGALGWLRPGLALLMWLAYVLGTLLLCAACLLVSLDSSLVQAAWLGDWWPLTGVFVALTPLCAVLLRGGKAAIKVIRRM
ncbi:hypothetical protein [Comamonas sp. NoAH]|uniref:hypothetical protein n=1 Tax=Comamonas halotolerans TaxID=3041496 RepID=UPI0024E1437D|nr:hypothetical protein [Comamonas sp. NoAH]